VVLVIIAKIIVSPEIILCNKVTKYTTLVVTIVVDSIKLLCYFSCFLTVSMKRFHTMPCRCSDLIRLAVTRFYNFKETLCHSNTLTDRKYNIVPTKLYRFQTSAAKTLEQRILDRYARGFVSARYVAAFSLNEV